MQVFGQYVCRQIDSWSLIAAKTHEDTKKLVYTASSDMKAVLFITYKIIADLCVQRAPRRHFALYK